MSGGEGHSEESLRKLGREFRSLDDIKDDEGRIAAVVRHVSDSARECLKPDVFSPAQRDCLVELANRIVVSLEGARRKPQGFWQETRRSWRETPWGVRVGLVLAGLTLLVTLGAWLDERAERKRLETQLQAPDGKAAPSPIQSSPPRVSLPRTVVAE